MWIVSAVHRCWSSGLCHGDGLGTLSLECAGSAIPWSGCRCRTASSELLSNRRERGKQGALMTEPRAVDLDLAAVEDALVRGAVGDYADEAAVLLLLNFGHWLPQLQSAGLISLVADVDGEGPWAQVDWPAVDKALNAGSIHGDGAALRVLWAAASVADGRPVDLGEVAAGLDRRGLALVLAAVAHAGGSHDHRGEGPVVGGVPGPGRRLPPLFGWPVID